MHVKLDRNSVVSIKKQLYNGLISMILDGTLSADEQLPSTRLLASELDIARNSVIEIYEQLVAEAYAYSLTGQGTFIADLEGSLYDKATTPSDCSRNTEYESEIKVDQSNISFVPGTPDLEHFPSRLWLDYMKDYLYAPKNKKVGYSDLKGYEPFRQELVFYLKKHKGFDCRADQIFITNGTSGALNLIAVTMRHKISNLLTESPVMHFVPEIFKCYDYDINTVKVDEKGLVTEDLKPMLKSCLIYTAPSHQMPLGVAMPINRRQELIRYAVEGGHFIIEDDYDSEFRYSGAPMNALKQIDTDRVIYMGTFSKTLGPGLRIGYMVVPNSLIEPFDKIYYNTYSHVQTMDQYCLYRLIKEGQYEKHIYKMTKLYKKKRDQLLLSVEKYLGDSVKVIGNVAGLHVSIRYHNRVFSEKDRVEMLGKGIEVDFLTDYLITKEKERTTDTLVIGFGHLSIREIEEGIKALAKG